MCSIHFITINISIACFIPGKANNEMNFFLLYKSISDEVERHYVLSTCIFETDEFCTFFLVEARHKCVGYTTFFFPRHNCKKHGFSSFFFFILLSLYTFFFI